MSKTINNKKKNNDENLLEFKTTYKSYINSIQKK